MAVKAWRVVRQALPALTVATFIPLGLFYLALTLGSCMWAIGVSVLYAWVMAAGQYVRRRKVSGMLMVTWMMATFRAVLALASGHTFLYFALPVLETAGFGLMFVVSLVTCEPLVVRLARDPVPSAADGLAERPDLVRALSAVWASCYVASAAATIVLLMTTPLPVFFAAHVATGWLCSATAGILTVLIVRRRAKGLFALVTGRTTPASGEASRLDLTLGRPVPELAAA